MKKQTIQKFYLCFLALILVSCSSNELDESISMNISGTWNSISFIANEPLFDVNNNGINSKELLEELPCRYSILKLNNDQTFYQENNTYKFDEITNSYSCTSGNDITSTSGKWSVNSDNTMLSLEIDGNTAFLEVEFDGETLKFNSSESFLNKNALEELKEIKGSVTYKR